MKKAVCFLCAVCLLLCSLPVTALAATIPEKDLQLSFNTKDWSGDTELIDQNGRFYAVHSNSTERYSLTYKNLLDLSRSNFSVMTYLRPLHSTSNRYGEYCSLKVGALELRVYLSETAQDVGVYWLSVCYNGVERATAPLEDPNHYYEIVNSNGLVCVRVDNAYVDLTDTSGNTVSGISNAAMQFNACDLSIILHGNWSSYRYAEGCIVDIDFADIVTNDVNYPDESLYVLDPNADGQVISYLNTAVTLPTGTDNTLKRYNYDGTYFASDLWQAVPMISQQMIDRGYIEGGEACQAVASVVCSSDSQLAMFGTDIGGIFRSLDGGTHWQPATIGFGAGGATGIAIDPMNKNHVIAVGCNTGLARSNGIFVTDDAYGQCEWTKALGAADISGTSKCIQTHNDYRIQIVYDVRSYDNRLGYCTRAYWSVEDVTITQDGTQYPQQAMWTTNDGGYSWTKLEKAVGTIYVDGVKKASSAFLAGAEMAVYTVGNTTYIYAATDEGFYISTDGGKNWTETMSELGVHANAIDVIDTCVSGYDASKVGYIWATTDSAMYRSTDFGYTWSEISGVYYPAAYDAFFPDNIAVSSLDGDNIYVTQREINGAGWFSNDGGKSWKSSTMHKKEAWQPVAGINPYGYWSNIHKDTFHAKANGLWKSIDGGANLHWSNSGFNEILITGSWLFNVNDPNLISVSSQDFNGGFSTDGGKTWTYLSWRGEGWGGFTYGAYMLDKNTMIACDAVSWDSDRYIWVTHDAGKSYVNTGIVVKGVEAGMGCLGADNIAFMGEWRTDDYGYTWSEMLPNRVTGSIGCDGVYAIDYQTGTLFGRNGSRVVYSSDRGISWHQLASGGGMIDDIAYDSQAGILYVTTSNALYSGYIDFTNPNNTLTEIEYLGDGVTTFANTVAVDPNHPNVVYVAGNDAINSLSYDNGGVFRSLDSGKTWTRLTRTAGDGRDLCADGAKGVGRIRINPATGELFAAGACKGMWKMAPPPEWYLDQIYTEPDTQAKVPADSDIPAQAKLDLMETGKHANYSTYTGKTVTLELISASAKVENGYFKVPDGVTIYTGDRIKLGCIMTTNFTMPNGAVAIYGCINTTYIRNDWGYSKQACSNSPDYHQFDQPGYYTIYTITGEADTNGWAMVTFYVADPYAGYTEISNQSQLAAIADDLDGNYVLTDDIHISGNWSSIGSVFNSFRGVLYGNGHTISGLNKPLFSINNGGISHLVLSGGSVCSTNRSYIAYCSVNDSICSTNSGTIKQCVVTANSSVAGSNSGGSINNCFYPSSMTVVGSGSLAGGDTNYGYSDITDAAQFAALDDNWYVSDGAAPVLRIERGYDRYTLTKPLSGYKTEGDYLYIDNVATASHSLTDLYTLVGATVGVYSADGALKQSQAALRTGDTLTLSWYDQTEALTVVIVGDVIPDGLMSGSDLLSVKLHTIGNGQLSDAAQRAADVNRDGVVNSADVLLYQQAMLGLTDILH